MGITVFHHVPRESPLLFSPLMTLALQNRSTFLLLDNFFSMGTHFPRINAISLPLSSIESTTTTLQLRILDVSVHLVLTYVNCNTHAYFEILCSLIMIGLNQKTESIIFQPHAIFNRAMMMFRYIFIELSYKPT